MPVADAVHEKHAYAQNAEFGMNMRYRDKLIKSLATTFTCVIISRYVVNPSPKLLKQKFQWTNERELGA